MTLPGGHDSRRRLAPNESGPLAASSLGWTFSPLSPPMIPTTLLFSARDARAARAASSSAWRFHASSMWARRSMEMARSGGRAARRRRRWKEREGGMLLQQPWRVSGREATATGATRRACAGVVLAAAALLLLLLQGEEAGTDGAIIVASEDAKGEGRERSGEEGRG